MSGPFFVRSASPESYRLLRLARRYVETLPRHSLQAVFVCSSVAWGTATFTSDLDLQIVVRDGEAPRREKRRFQDEYVDHFEWPESEFEAAAAGWIRDPLSHPIGSYSAAYSLILLDDSGAATACRDRLLARMQHPEEVRRWIDSFLLQAEQHRLVLDEVAAAADAECARSRLWECVHALAEAVLHLEPGGHCGQWPYQLRRLAARDGLPFYEGARELLAPEGVDLALLGRVIDPLERLHEQTAHARAGAPLGASAVSAGYFARKARFYRQERDALSLRVTLDRQLGYVRGNLAAKDDRFPDESCMDEVAALVEAIHRAWPEAADWPARLRALGKYHRRISAGLSPE